jgi:hypothetical protein
MAYRHMDEDELEALKFTIIDAVEPFAPFGAGEMTREMLLDGLCETNQFFLETMLLALHSGRALVDDAEMAGHDLTHLAEGSTQQ